MLNSSFITYIINPVSAGLCARLRQKSARIPPICVMVTLVRKSLSKAIDNMKKPQFLKFAKAIDDNTGVKETISAFENKKGYAGKRTLERCVQAATRFKEGLPSKVIAEKTGWSVKYVDKIRSWWEEGEFPLHEQQLKQTILDPRLMKHLDELAETAEILAHHGRRLLRYKDDGNVEATGDVFSHLSFWCKPTMQPIQEGSWTEEFAYEKKHPIDPYLAGLLYIHYRDRFGRPPFKEWNQLSIGNVSRKIVDNLRFLAHGGLELCRDCPICLQR